MKETEELQRQLEIRFQECSLRLHPEKTKIIYCKEGNRKGDYPNVKFDFLGYTFKPRAIMHNGKRKTGYLPAVSRKAQQRLRMKLRNSRVFRWTDISLGKLSDILNPILTGWFNYFTYFYRSAIWGMCQYLNQRITNWTQRKYRKSKKAAIQWITARRLQGLVKFAHWNYVTDGNGLFV